MLLKDKFILYLTADPLEFSKSTFLGSTKKSLFENQDDLVNNKKKILFEGNNKTIILGSDIEELNRKIHKKSNGMFGSFFKRESNLEKSFGEEDFKSHGH